VRRAASRPRWKRSLALLIAVGVVAAVGVQGSLAAFSGTPNAAAMHAQVFSTARCASVSVTDSSGNAVSGGYASITLKTSGGSTVLAVHYGLVTNGVAQVCYGGASLPASVDVSGFVDTNGNGTQDAGEPAISGSA
jgi:hypothetical protein